VRLTPIRAPLERAMRVPVVIGDSQVVPLRVDDQDRQTYISP
jgi:hypothetical protein